MSKYVATVMINGTNNMHIDVVKQNIETEKLRRVTHEIIVEH